MGESTQGPTGLPRQHRGICHNQLYKDMRICEFLSIVSNIDQLCSASNQFRSAIHLRVARIRVSYRCCISTTQKSAWEEQDFKRLF